MSIPAAGSRWLLVRGRRTAVRLALPSFGALTIGSGADCDVCVDEPGVARRHLGLQLDPGIAIEVLEGDTGAFGKSGVERALSAGTKIRAAAGDRLRVGSVELSFLDAQAGDEGARRRVWARAYFERAVQAKLRGTILRIRSADEGAEAILLEQAELVAAISPNEWAVYARDAE